VRDVLLFLNIGQMMKSKMKLKANDKPRMKPKKGPLDSLKNEQSKEQAGAVKSGSSLPKPNTKMDPMAASVKRHFDGKKKKSPMYSY